MMHAFSCLKSLFYFKSFFSILVAQALKVKSTAVEERRVSVHNILNQVIIINI